MSALRSCIERTTWSLVSPLCPDLPRHEAFWDNADRLAASLEHGIREHSHQTHAGAAVY